jgi:hypothetical protein
MNWNELGTKTAWSAIEVLISGVFLEELAHGERQDSLPD